MKKKVVAALLSLFVLFAVGAGVASWYVASTSAELGRLVDLHEVEGLRRALVITVQTVQADLYSQHTPMARSLDRIVENVREMEDAADECNGCHHPPQLEARLDRVQALIQDYEAALSYYITASADRERMDRIGLDAARTGDRIIRRTEGMSAEASQRLDEITDHVSSRINRVRFILLLTLVLTVLFGLGVSLYLVRSVTRPVQRLVEATRVIASGRLGHRLEEEPDPEFAELGRHFNAMSASLERGYEMLESANADLQREIRERQEAEKEREELQKQLMHAQKVQALGTLSAGIAHEFNNFLQVIRGCTENLRGKIGSGGPGQRELGMIEEAAERGAGLTRRLLTVGRKGDFRPVPVALNRQVLQVKTALEGILPRSIEIQVSLDDGIRSVNADPAQIEQVLLNLALNARDAMPEGGVLRFETFREADGDAVPGGSPDGGPTEWVVLRVSDTGHGMDEATLEHIYDPFFTTKQVGEGTGLGLATVYAIVTDHRGRIRCESEVGRGTRFEIRLPALDGPSESLEAASRVPESRRGDAKTLLIIDDEPSVLETMKEGLELRGCVVHTAGSGERAVELFEERGHEVDLVVLDLGMPGMGGIACLRRLLEIRPGIRIVVTSGYVVQEQQDEVLASGACEILAKPYRISDILKRLESA